MRVLVTGGAGFIGSHVVDQLVQAGASVRVVDSLDPSVHPGVPDYLNPRADLLVGDLADARVATAAVAGVDAVCHQAAKVGLGVNFGDVGGYVAANDSHRRPARGAVAALVPRPAGGGQQHGGVRRGPVSL